MTTQTTDVHQLRLSDSLLSLDGYVLSIVNPAFEPGIFFKHVETVKVDVKEAAEGIVARFSTIGGTVPWQVIRIKVEREELPAFARFLDKTRKARERSLAVTV